MLWGTYSLLNKITMMPRRITCTQLTLIPRIRAAVIGRARSLLGGKIKKASYETKNGLWIGSWRKMGFQHIKREHPWIRVIENTRRFWYNSQWGKWERRLDHGNENNEKEKPTTCKRLMYHGWQRRRKRSSWRNTHNRRTYKVTQKFGSWVSWRIVVIIRPENRRGKKIELCQDASLDSENDSSAPNSFLLLISDSVLELLTTSQHPLSPYLIPNSCYTVFLGLSPYTCSPHSCWHRQRVTIRHEWVAVAWYCELWPNYLCRLSHPPFPPGYCSIYRPFPMLTALDITLCRTMCPSVTCVLNRPLCYSFWSALTSYHSLQNCSHLVGNLGM